MGRLSPANQALEDAVLAALRDAPRLGLAVHGDEAGWLTTDQVAVRVGITSGAEQYRVWQRLDRLARQRRVHRRRLPGFRSVWWRRAEWAQQEVHPRPRLRLIRGGLH
jgi:hypothetical protein